MYFQNQRLGHPDHSKSIQPSGRVIFVILASIFVDNIMSISTEKINNRINVLPPKPPPFFGFCSFYKSRITRATLLSDGISQCLPSLAKTSPNDVVLEPQRNTLSNIISTFLL